MKHSLKITLILAILFLLSQVIGLLIINKDITVVKKPDGTITTVHISEAIIGKPPVQKSTGFLYIISMVLIGTGLVFLLIRFKIVKLWKFWFFIAILFCLTIALSTFIDYYIAFFISLVLVLIRMFKPGVVIHNLTEVFMYSGIALILVQWMNLFAGFMLLLLISVYDMIAVWKSKHMIKLAKFQTKAKTFAGLLIPYKKTKFGKTKSISKKTKMTKTAILGGGDIGFPLVFAGIVMENLILVHNVAKPAAFFKTLLIPLFTTIALLWLLLKGKENKFYPAMPFLSAGCFVGYLVVLLVI